MIIPYSAMNRRANSTLENSMLKPLTSSLSASAKSKGLRLVSARIIIVAGIVAYFLFDTQPLRTIPNLMIPIKVIMNSRFAWNLIGLNVSGSPHQKSMNRVSISFNPSKIGCISPMIIALFGPSRRWLMPMYCRSIRVTKATDRRIVMVMASRLVAHNLNAEIVVNSIAIGINLWLTPQSSEHCPYIIPGSMDSEVVELMRPGMASILILSAGIVHLWITSADVTDMRIDTLVGRMVRLSQSRSRKSCDSHSFMNDLKDGGVGGPSSVRSKEAFDSLTPVNPPIVNSNRNPSTHNIAGAVLIWLPYNVANHLKIFTPVGIPMIIVAAVNGPNTLNFPDISISASDTTPKAGSTRI
ncbi:hypothetical protein T4D_5498 [Trichinella pseudospiralis]|uniref:Uncharacterized protein n=1 Tax=Trichinella pseudospiralis TaxID=6337 RepID=A0A0V1F5K7_TRIPS|nr:hypothetical protein T4D_5498 [Trichinella pseudospiralis]